MLAKWEFWGGFVAIGVAIFVSGLGGRWADQSDRYSDETTWVIGVGVVLIVVSVLGLIYSYFVSREERPAPLSVPDMSVISHDQQGGFTIGELNVGEKKDD